MVEFACGILSLFTGQSLADIAREVDCETTRHPLGICVGITPFKLPVMVLLWMFPVAITCGNTFVLKPSEKVPLSAVCLSELLIESGLSEGVSSLVHGDCECAAAPLSHPLVRAASFVSSTAVARSIYETGARHGKRVQATGGAKNHLIIMPGADLDHAIGALKLSASGYAGERCMAGSIGVPVGRVADALVEKLCESAQAMQVGPTDGGAAIDMGPVISPEHLTRVAGYLDIGREEGAKLAVDGCAHPAAGSGFIIGPSVLDHVSSAMRVAREEIFGPVLSVVRAVDLEEALAIGRDCPCGNGASIFTRSGWAARQFKHHFNAAMIGINVGVPAPMAWFSFTGWNGSFFGDLHIQGTESVQFFTQRKLTMTRWFETRFDSHHDPVWKTGKG
jgi:malonate-semialdehyde dehydrogenase (acetylating) / methylmalonate-semialdehyde dehydrogenase